MNLAICGRRFQGKSTLALYLSLRIRRAKNGHTVAIFDPKRSFRSIPSTQDIEEFERMMESGRHEAVAFVPNSFDNAEDQQISDKFDEFIYALGIEEHLGSTNPSRRNLRSVVVVVDEVWLLKDSATLENLVRLADMEGVYLIQVSHRPIDFPTDVRGQFNEWYIFRQWLPSDLEVLGESCGASVMELSEKLPAHHVIRYDADSHSIAVWSNPSAWYISMKSQEGVAA